MPLAIFGGNAVYVAAGRLKRVVLKHAATLLQCAAEGLHVAYGIIRWPDGTASGSTAGDIAQAIRPVVRLSPGRRRWRQPTYSAPIS